MARRMERNECHPTQIKGVALADGLTDFKTKDIVVPGGRQEIQVDAATVNTGVMVIILCAFEKNKFLLVTPGRLVSGQPPVEMVVDMGVGQNDGVQAGIQHPGHSLPAHAGIDQNAVGSSLEIKTVAIGKPGMVVTGKVIYLGSKFNHDVKSSVLLKYRIPNDHITFRDKCQKVRDRGLEDQSTHP